MFHIIFLVLLLLVYSFFHFREKPNRKMEVVAMSLVIFLFGALRGKNVGIDVHTYFDYYEQCVSIPLATFFQKSTINTFYQRDTGFYILLKLLTYVSSNPQLMLVVISAWFSFAFAYFVYNQKGNTFIIFIMFITFRIYAFTLTGLRETVALGFILFAICQLQKQKIFKSLLLTIMASFFHLSSIVFVLAIILSFIKNYKIVCILIMGMTIINLLTQNQLIYYFSKVLLNGRYSQYGEKAVGQAISFSSTFIIFIVFYLFVLLNNRKIKESNEIINVDFNTISLGMAFLITGLSVDNIFRLGYYFIFLLFPLFDVSINYFANKKTAIIVKVIICLLLATQYIILGPGAGVTDYNFFW